MVAQVDIEAPKLGYQMPIQHAVHGDARATAEALLAELDRRGMTSPKDGRRSDTMRERIRAGDNHHFSHPDESSGQFIDPRTLSKAVDAILPADRVVASDSGHFCGWVPRYLRVPNARASCLSHSFQSVGLGLASTVGLAIANPGKLAVQTNDEEKSGDVLYQGIAARNFKRSFQLADHVQVKGASLENGLLHIDLVREIPEAMKPRAIPIANSSKVLEVQPTKLAA